MISFSEMAEIAIKAGIDTPWEFFEATTMDRRVQTNALVTGTNRTKKQQQQHKKTDRDPTLIMVLCNSYHVEGVDHSRNRAII